jgi:catechol 2,3-dioxygenase-like lactoylglutathione lyase family enzyme
MGESAAQQPTAFVTNRISEIYAHVGNYDEAVKWYTEVLGLSLHPQGGIDLQGIRLFIIESDKRNPTTHAVFNLVASDIRKAYEELRSRGAETDEIYYDPYENAASFHVKDPSGGFILIKEC